MPGSTLCCLRSLMVGGQGTNKGGGEELGQGRKEARKEARKQGSKEGRKQAKAGVLICVDTQNCVETKSCQITPDASSQCMLCTSKLPNVRISSIRSTSTICLLLSTSSLTQTSERGHPAIHPSKHPSKQSTNPTKARARANEQKHTLFEACPLPRLFLSLLLLLFCIHHPPPLQPCPRLQRWS